MPTYTHTYSETVFFRPDIEADSVKFRCNFYILAKEVIPSGTGRQSALHLVCTLPLMNLHNVSTNHNLHQFTCPL